MRVLVMFDLPVETAADRKEYRKFRKYLIKSGYLMLQKSVYCKLVQNSQAADALVNNLYRNRPVAGSVQVLRVTEKQFSKMEFIVGTKQTDVIDTDERILFL